jgi:hypothetical protein
LRRDCRRFRHGNLSPVKFMSYQGIVTCSSTCPCGSHCPFSGSFSDGPGDYGNSQTCSWLVASSYPTNTMIAFCGYDFVTINECSSESCTTRRQLARRKMNVSRKFSARWSPRCSRWQDASMPRQAAPASAGAQATNEDEILHWRSLRHSVAAFGRQSSSEGPHSLAHAVAAEESAHDGRGDEEARSPGAAFRKSTGCCSRARALSFTPTKRASQCRRPLPFRRTSTCTAFIHYLVGILFLSLLAVPPARAGLFWSSLAFDSRILHAPTILKVAFRMPITLARDEMVTLCLPGFRQDMRVHAAARLVLIELLVVPT